MYNEGISIAGEILDMGVDSGFIDKSGAWYPMGTNASGKVGRTLNCFLDRIRKL